MSNDVNGRRCGVLTIALSTIGVLAIVFVALVVGSVFYSVHSISSSMKSGLVSGNKKFNYTLPSSHEPYIAGIKLSGEINDNVADEVLDKLTTAQFDSNAVGVLFEVNSPGGVVVPSQEIYDEVKAIRAVKPIVVYVRSMAASGAYYSSASASKIVANRGSLIGSIGVIMQSFEADKLIQFLKVNPVTIKTGALKDAGSPTRPMNENDKKYLQNLIDSTRAEFVSDVKAGREVTEKTLELMSDGRVVLAPQALELKLIDEIGGKNVALNEIAQLAKLKQAPELFYYENIDSFSDLFSQKFSSKIQDVFNINASHILNLPFAGGASLKME
jgi:protease-4